STSSLGNRRPHPPEPGRLTRASKRLSPGPSTFIVVYPAAGIRPRAHARRAPCRDPLSVHRLDRGDPVAILLSSKNLETSFVVRTDIDRLIEHIRSTAASALPGSPYTVYFLGEAHSNDFDVRRRGGVYEALMDDRRVMLALERTFAKAGDADNMVVESNDLKSADDG